MSSVMRSTVASAKEIVCWNASVLLGMFDKYLCGACGCDCGDNCSFSYLCGVFNIMKNENSDE